MKKTIIYYSSTREDPEFERKIMDYTIKVDERPEGLRKILPYWGDVQKLRAKFS